MAKMKPINKSSIKKSELEAQYPEADIDYMLMMLENEIYLYNYEVKKKKDIDELFTSDNGYINQLRSIYAKHFSELERFDDSALKLKPKFLKDWDKLKDKMQNELLEMLYENISSIYNYNRLYHLWMLDERVLETDEFKKPDIDEYSSEMYVGEADESNKRKKKLKVYDVPFTEKKFKELIEKPRYNKTTSERIAQSISKTDAVLKGVFNDALIPLRDGNGRTYLSVLKKMEKGMNDYANHLTKRAIEFDIQGVTEDAENDVLSKNAHLLPDRFQRVEVLDNRTCLVCSSRDGNISKKRIGRIHPHCFPTGIIITTIDGEKDISDVKIGDVTYTHKGNWKRVVRLFEHHYEGELVKIHLSDGKFLIATPNHKIRVLDSNGYECWKEIGLISTGEKIIIK